MLNKWMVLPVAVMILMGATQCEQQAADTRAKLADEEIANMICEVWQPITDTTSPQVKAQNRARYGFCELGAEQIGELK